MEKKTRERERERKRESSERGPEGQFISLTAWIQSHSTWLSSRFCQGTGICLFRSATPPGGVGKERAWAQEGKVGCSWFCSSIFTHPSP